jgi:hypothetical protein
MNRPKVYKTKHRLVDAIKWTGSNFAVVAEFANGSFFIIDEMPYIRGPHGKIPVSTNDYIVKGIDGNYRPIESSIFRQVYENVQ